LIFAAVFLITLFFAHYYSKKGIPWLYDITLITVLIGNLLYVLQIYGVNFSLEQSLPAHIFRLPSSIALIIVVSFVLRSNYWLKKHTHYAVLIGLIFLFIYLLGIIFITEGRAAIVSVFVGSVILFFKNLMIPKSIHGERYIPTHRLFFLVLVFVGILGVLLDQGGLANVRNFMKVPDMEYIRQLYTAPVIDNLKQGFLKTALTVLNQDRVLNHQFIFQEWSQFFPLGRGVNYRFDYGRLGSSLAFIGFHSSYVYVVAVGGYIAFLAFFMVILRGILNVLKRNFVYSVLLITLFIQSLTETQVFNFSFWFILAMSLVRFSDKQTKDSCINAS